MMRILIMALLGFQLAACAGATKNEGTGAQETAVATVPSNPESVQPLKVGASVPNVNVMQADGKAVSLSELTKGKKSVLVFYRGGWCPYCNTHLSELRKAEKSLLKSGVQILAISPDRPEEMAKTVAKNKLKYTLLSDSKADAAKAFGIAFQVDETTVAKYKNEYKIDLEASSGETHHILPVPAIYVTNEQGQIMFQHVDPDYRARLAPEVLLSVVKSMPKAEAKSMN